MDNKKFTYTYSPEEQEEIKNILKKYTPKEESKIERLRRLDESAERKAGVLALTLGIVSTLIMGFGMCCCMVWSMFITGIITGVTGIVGICLAYPVYIKTADYQRKKIASEVLSLAEELLD